MITRQWFLQCAVAIFCAQSVGAVDPCDFTSGSTGADGDLAPTEDVTLQVPPDGVFNFENVDIPEGVTVKFNVSTGTTPVVILSRGSITISGAIDIAGAPGDGVRGGRGGAGGFDGGNAGTTCAGTGLGPTGGGPSCVCTCRPAAGGGYGTRGGDARVFASTCASGGPVSGSEALVPLLGGSGGGGGGAPVGFGGGGGGGGGAIVIAASGDVTIDGTINANGGDGAQPGGGGGAGGGVRIIADAIRGDGTITTSGGAGADPSSCGGTAGDGGIGRARLESCQVTFQGVPPGAVVDFVAGVPIPVVGPSLEVTMVGAFPVPPMPNGRFLPPIDVVLPSGTGTVPVEIAGSGIPPTTEVIVTVIPSTGPTYFATGELVGTFESSTALINLPLMSANSVIIAATE